MSIVFKKVNSTKYILENVAEIKIKVDGLFKAIHEGTEGEYEINTTRDIYDSLLARIVAVEFFKQGQSIDDLNFVNIDVNINGETLTCVAGLMPINGKPVRTSGVLYG